MAADVGKRTIVTTAATVAAGAGSATDASKQIIPISLDEILAIPEAFTAQVQIDSNGISEMWSKTANKKGGGGAKHNKVHSLAAFEDRKSLFNAQTALSDDEVFRIRFADAATIKLLVKILSALITEATVIFDADGISICEMDSSHVAYCIMQLHSHKMLEYQIADKHVLIGVIMASLKKVMELGSNASSLVWGNKRDQGLDIRFESIERDASNQPKRVFEQSLHPIDIDGDRLGIPEIKYDYMINMAADEFATTISQCQKLVDTVNIKCDKDGLVFDWKGDLGPGHTDFKNAGTKPANGDYESNVVYVDTEAKEPIEMRLAIRYLAMFAASAAIARRLTIYMTLGSPCKFEYHIGHFEEGILTYYLAPKISDDEEIK